MSIVRNVQEICAIPLKKLDDEASKLRELNIFLLIKVCYPKPLGNLVPLVETKDSQPINPERKLSPII